MSDKYGKLKNEILEIVAIGLMNFEKHPGLDEWDYEKLRTRAIDRYYGRVCSGDDQYASPMFHVCVEVISCAIIQKVSDIIRENENLNYHHVKCKRS